MSQTPVTGIGMEEDAAPLHPQRALRKLPYPLIVLILIIAAAYCVTGRLSLLLAIPPGYATAVWPPSGIALAGVLLCGYRVWPGIVLGSFLVNIWTSFDTANAVAMFRSAALATSIGIGAALQALVGAFLVRRFVGFPNALDQGRDIAKFLVLGGPISCLVSATWGVTSLLLGGVIPWANCLFNWWTWWVGDTIGALTVTQLILVWTAEPRQVWRRRQLSVALPLGITFTVVVVFFVYARGWEQDRLKLEFERRAGSLGQTLMASFDGYLDVLHSIESLYASSRGVVSRYAFRTFVQRLLTRHPGIQALAWGRRVLDAERDAYEEAVRREGYPDFQITERNAQGQVVRAARRPEYVPVVYIEPYKGNESALGYDGTSDATRLAWFHRARDTGEICATGRITLVQETGQQFGVSIYLPIYSGGLLYTTVEERHQNLRGYVVGVFQIDDMVEASLPTLAREGIELRLYDETAPAGERLLYSRQGRTQGGMSRAFDEADGETAAGLQWGATFEVGGRRWTLRFSPTPVYLAMQRVWQVWLVLACGALLVGLLGAFLLVLAGRTASIEQTNAALAHEIAERQRAEEALLEREVKAGAVLETAADGIITIDAQGLVESFNPAAERMFGYTATEMMGQNIRMLMPSPYREEHDAYLARYLHTGERRIIGIGREVIGQRKDGTTFPLELAVSEVRMGTQRLFTGIVRDITERKRAAELFHLAIEAAPTGMILVNQAGRITLVNAQVEKCFGYRREELIGQSVEILVPTRFRGRHPEFRHGFFLDPQARPMGAGRDLYGLHKDGTEVPIEIGLNPLTTSEGTFVLSSVVDITERRRAEGELQRTVTELARSNAELEQFAYVASHDLKAPLRGIAQLAAWIEEELTDVLKGDTRQMMELLHGRVRRLEALLDDLLQYSRAGRDEETVKVVNTRALITDIVTLLAPPPGFVCTVAETLPTFATAEEPLWQVFTNLIGNAIKHHDRPDGQVTISVKDQGECYEFLVADDGPGIPPIFHQKIFQMFQTLKPRDEVEGSGMGLAIAKKVVEGQGGTIRIESDAGCRGTAFRFTWRKQWPGR